MSDSIDLDSEAPIINEPTPPEQPSPKPRTGTLVIGFALLSIAALAWVAASVDLGQFNPAIVTAWVIVGLGGVMVIGALLGWVLRITRGGHPPIG